MTAIHAPELVSPDLLELTRSLGRPERDLVILAEGNTSQRLADGRLVVKASGANMATATADDFVTVDVEPFLDLLRRPTSTQAEATAALDAGTVGGRRRRGSIEALVHIAVQAVSPVEFIGHTHPTAILGLMASVRAEQAYRYWVYSDEAVVIGKPLYVPYFSPGIDLGRAFYTALRNYADEQGQLPQLVLLGNHGIVAIAPTAAGVDGISSMAVKGAQVRSAAYAAGGVSPIPTDSVAKFFAREDISERRGKLEHGRF
ncbi:Class II Aldolase and Adducin N-terminal domain-containing protein [Nakamurella panacisegetis]|uniref:Class II Aldolase and Adducin N-terminal domain-containing protein n=1 Tax=Nakamurella panacisegetis TaxID=1090615 RepID=A0A1H0K142_9ACTN|nr:class II aldolase/adducin family protein [Nakamurella panacisegetis]SDO49677.1 Class II Aldolase and Adducin N-terminal domain-containing protein [Nakamurella panacisegetis]